MKLQADQQPLLQAEYSHADHRHAEHSRAENDCQDNVENDILHEHDSLYQEDEDLEALA